MIDMKPWRSTFAQIVGIIIGAIFALVISRLLWPEPEDIGILTVILWCVCVVGSQLIFGEIELRQFTRELEELSEKPPSDRQKDGFSL